MDETLKSLMVIIIGLICILIAFFVYFCPTIIAFNRGHHYKWIILGINLILGATGIGYMIAFAWAVWPRQTTITDLVRNDPTDNSLNTCKKYYQKRGELDRDYDQARYGTHVPQAIPCEQTRVAQSVVGPVKTNANRQMTKACPFCGESIRLQAIKCKHCQSMLNG